MIARAISSDCPGAVLTDVNNRSKPVAANADNHIEPE
jgi:hypothetical protein